MASTGGRAEAERWLVIAEKLLASCDLHGSKTFAIRARDSDPRLDRSDRILAVVDTLIAGNARINNDNQHDWYAILQLVRGTQDSRLVSTQYTRLASLLSPVTNTLPFADQAFRLVSDAFSVLSNPSKKSLYDHELSLFPDSNRESQPSPSAPQPQPQPPVGQKPRAAAKNSENLVNESIPSSADVSNFWTACPYCFNLFEYPRVYEECSLRCQNCRRAFQAVVVPPPPAIGSGKDSYFCCWEFFPLGFSVDNSHSAKKANVVSNWAPFSAMFACPSPANGRPNVASNVEGTPNVSVLAGNKSNPKPRNANAANREVARVVIDEEDDVFVDLSIPSEESDDDWDKSNRKKKRAKNVGRVSSSKNVKARKGGQGAAGEVKKHASEISGAGYVMQGGVGLVNAADSDLGKKVAASSSKRQMGKAAKDLGKLDLNVEFSNDVEEPTVAVSGNGARNGEEDGMEGIAFFDGLDEFLSSLPILSVVGDEKGKAAD